MQFIKNKGDILVFHDMQLWKIIWQDQSYTEQNKLRQKLPLVGLKLTASGLSL